VVQVDAACADAPRLQQIEELTASAADVQDVRSSLEQRQVRLEARANRVARAAELILEAEVFICVERRAEGV